MILAQLAAVEIEVRTAAVLRHRFRLLPELIGQSLCKAGEVLVENPIGSQKAIQPGIMADGKQRPLEHHSIKTFQHADDIALVMM